MAYIGRDISNLSDRAVLDNITTSATATYNLLLNGVAFVPSSAESLTVSLNGIIQKPQSSYSVSNSTIVFDSPLTSSDSIDFILAERAITLTTVGSGSVGTSQLADSAVTTSKISIPDDAVLNIGTGNDLAIYHESSSNKSYIKESGSADLVIAGNDILFRNTDDTETMAYFQNNGAVTLKYDHSTKFATTSTGIDVTGAITVNGSALGGGQTKAWVNFEMVGTFSVRDSFNVSSISDEGTGDVNVNFTTAFANDDYCAGGVTRFSSSNTNANVCYRGVSNPLSTTTAQMAVRGMTNNSASDSDYVTIIFSGDQ